MGAPGDILADQEPKDEPKLPVKTTSKASQPSSERLRKVIESPGPVAKKWRSPRAALRPWSKKAKVPKKAKLPKT